MIWMLYYVIGFWLTFSLVVLCSMKAQSRPDDIETGEEPPAVFAALVLAMVWPVGLPTYTVINIVNWFHNDDSPDENERTANQGYRVS